MLLSLSLSGQSRTLCAMIPITAPFPMLPRTASGAGVFLRGPGMEPGAGVAVSGEGAAGWFVAGQLGRSASPSAFGLCSQPAQLRARAHAGMSPTLPGWLRPAHPSRLSPPSPRCPCIPSLIPAGLGSAGCPEAQSPQLLCRRMGAPWQGDSLAQGTWFSFISFWH